MRCAQGGLRVLVLERQSGERYLCNSRLSAGVWHICASDVLEAPAVLESKILAATGGEADPALAWMVAHEAARVIDWLRTLGVRFMKGPYAYQRFVMAPPAVSPQGAAWEGRGPDVALQMLEEALNGLGGSLLRGHRATGLETRQEGIGGLRGLTQSSEPFEVRAGNVIIADGGFQSDPGLVREWIAPDPGRVLARNSRASSGDGLRMAQEAVARPAICGVSMVISCRRMPRGTRPSLRILTWITWRRRGWWSMRRVNGLPTRAWAGSFLPIGLPRAPVRATTSSSMTSGSGKNVEPFG